MNKFTDSCINNQLCSKPIKLVKYFCVDFETKRGWYDYFKDNFSKIKVW